jgi:hypothetical protein
MDNSGLMLSNLQVTGRIGTVAENTRPAQKSTATRFAQVFGDLSQGRRWGSDGASLESVSGFSDDPIESDWNLYRYCGNSPLTGVDPTGLAGDDIAYIDYLCKKNCLSPEGREALHEALKAVKGVGGTASKAAAEAEAESIAALRGKFVLKNCGKVIGVVGVWLSLENTAQGAEPSRRQQLESCFHGEKKKCECARFEYTLIVPSWWAIFDKSEIVTKQRLTKWTYVGMMEAADCESLGTDEQVVGETSVRGFTIYTISYVNCHFRD